MLREPLRSRLSNRLRRPIIVFAIHAAHGKRDGTGTRLKRSARFLIPGSRVRISAGVMKSTGFPVLFSFQARGSFVAPASILKNPQISTGRRGPSGGVARCPAGGGSLTLAPRGGHGARAKGASRDRRHRSSLRDSPAASGGRRGASGPWARPPHPAWRSCLASFFATSPTSGQFRDPIASRSRCSRMAVAECS